MPSDSKPEKVTPFNPQTGQGCPAGTTAIGVDSSGTSICAGSGTSPSTPTQTEVREPTVNVTNPDGSTSSTDVIRRTNADGSVTTTTINVNISPTGVKTTTTSTVTGNAPGGGAGKNDKANDDPKGNSPVATGELYAKKDKTFQTVFGAWKTSLETAPVVAAGKAFFTVNVSGGGCPSWSADVPYLNTTISMGDIFCGSTANSIYAVIKIGLLIGAAYMAFRMAFL
ncbi:hypothetical protein [Oxalicibacterium faecigallinarum]|nr:hypothetical protein [Oxalicibacterium faecigallinarum]